MGDACARGLIRRSLSPDVCSCYVPWNASTSMAWRGMIIACRDLPITFMKDTEEVKYRSARLSH